MQGVAAPAEAACARRVWGFLQARPTAWLWCGAEGGGAGCGGHLGPACVARIRLLFLACMSLRCVSGMGSVFLGSADERKEKSAQGGRVFRAGLHELRLFRLWPV